MRIAANNIIVAIVLLLSCVDGYAEQTLTASWYSVESCKREGTSGIMANGEVLNDDNFTCASWDYSFKTILKVTNLRNNKTVIVVVTDRGPAKKLYRMGRVIDFSKAAFGAIADLEQGVIPIKVKIIK